MQLVWWFAVTPLTWPALATCTWWPSNALSRPAASSLPGPWQAPEQPSSLLPSPLPKLLTEKLLWWPEAAIKQEDLSWLPTLLSALTSQGRWSGWRFPDPLTWQDEPPNRDHPVSQSQLVLMTTFVILSPDELHVLFYVTLLVLNAKFCNI